MNNEYKFFASTQNGILIKPLIETHMGLSNSIIFFINKLGIHTYILNSTKQTLIQTELAAAKFDKFTCNDHQIRVMMILDELYTHIKSIKKKNVLTFFIEKSNPNQFGIGIAIHSEHTNSNIARIRIMDVYDSIQINTDFNYKHVYKISSKDLQTSIRELIKMSDIAIVYGYKSYMGIKVEKDDVIVKEYRYNILDERTADSPEERENAYINQVHTSLLNDICKLLSIHKHAHIYLTAGLPIKIEIDTGSVVKSDIFIKTCDMAVGE